jgi:hypothetical protein
MAPAQKARCIAVMDQLQKFYITRMFLQPVDPVRDACPTYLTIVHNPMDLGTARRKLEEDQYGSVEQWKADVNLVWANTFQYNGQKSLLSAIAKHLQTVFGELTSTLSSDPNQDWNRKFDDLKAEANNIIKGVPKVRETRIPRKILPTRSLSTQPEKILKPIQPAPEMTTDEICRLADEVNLIEDPNQVDQIIELIQRMEPDHRLMGDDDELELDVTKLKQATLFELRGLVTKLLGR